MELIDLHTHTTASDGIYSPAALIDLAIEKGVGVLAITDHDTVGGLAEALGHAAEKNFSLIPGIEFSIDFRGGSFHLVGLGIDHRNGDLLEVTEGLRKTRSTRITRIVEDLGKHGIVVSEEEIIKEAGGESMGRPHVARVLIRHGFGKDMEDIFARYLVQGRPGYVKKDKIQLAEAIRLIRGAGASRLSPTPNRWDSRSSHGSCRCWRNSSARALKVSKPMPPCTMKATWTSSVPWPGNTASSYREEATFTVINAKSSVTTAPSVQSPQKYCSRSGSEWEQFSDHSCDGESTISADPTTFVNNAGIQASLDNGILDDHPSQE